MLTRLLVGRDPRRTLLRAALLVAVSAVVFGVVLRPVRTQGVSMQPTIGERRLLFVNTLAYAFDLAPRRGDIVAIRLAGPNVLYIKRVVALPYERVRIVGGHVIVDDAPLDEPYVSHRAAWEYTEVTLAPGEYFVVGDNRGMRQELHDFGRVDLPRIVGKVVWP